MTTPSDGSQFLCVLFSNACMTTDIEDHLKIVFSVNIFWKSSYNFLLSINISFEMKAPVSAELMHARSEPGLSKLPS